MSTALKITVDHAFDNLDRNVIDQLVKDHAEEDTDLNEVSANSLKF